MRISWHARQLQSDGLVFDSGDHRLLSGECSCQELINRTTDGMYWAHASAAL